MEADRLEYEDKAVLRQTIALERDAKSAKPSATLKPTPLRDVALQKGSSASGRDSSKYSTEKRVGARVYARWSHEHYFWGYISKVVETSADKQFYDVSVDHIQVLHSD